jgi:hypothetical protein
MANRRNPPKRDDKPDMEKLPDFTEQDLEDIKEAFDLFKNENGVSDLN